MLDSYDVHRSFPQHTTSMYLHHGRRVYVRRYHPTYVERRYYTYTQYTKALELTLFDQARYQALAPRDRDNAIVWQAGVVATDREDDLRAAVDFLLVGTFKYFGGDTGGTKNVTLSERDARVAAVREAPGQAKGPEPRAPRAVIE